MDYFFGAKSLEVFGMQGFVEEKQVILLTDAHL